MTTRPATRYSLGLACIAFAALYAWLAARSFQAARLASSLDITSLERAIAIAPRDAAYQDLLCRYLLFDQQAPAAALPHCQGATELNRYASAYWLDLALAYYNTGAEREQQQAIVEAVSVDPMTPDVAWTAANFFLAQDKVPEALHEFSVAMRGDPATVPPALDLCWRATHDARAIQAILPPDPQAYLQFIRLLIANNQWEFAHEAWSAMLQLNAAADYRNALFYVDALLQNREAGRAHQAWEQLASRSPALAHYIVPGDLVVDGGFEQPILNAGFDWRYSLQPGSVIALDPDQHHSGAQSLLITYNGAGGDAGVLQYVPVKPNTQYTISAWVRSEHLDAANGPVISISDAYDGKPLVQTQEILGTTTWHSVEANFQAGPQTELVTIRISRDPATTHIKGKFWIDDLSLHLIPAS